jgi:hypothetical protein
MKDLKEIRFIATNYYNLQGLRTVPFSLYLVLICVWASAVRYPLTPSSFSVPVIELIVISILFFGIRRYYLQTFGQVQLTPESHRLEWLVSVIGGILALAAFWLDITYRLPVSLVGLVFGVGLLADYIRITWLVKGRFLLYYPLGSILMIVVSILPLLGASKWWHIFNLKSQMIGIAIIIGVFSIIAGVWGHFYLVHTLLSRKETK